MKKAAFLTSLALIILINYNCRAQVIDQYGDNVGTLNGIMKAY